MPLEGLQLGRYRLASLLGSGGMGEVYIAEDTLIHRQVALKVIRADSAAYPDAEAAKDFERLFQREVQAIASLDHPNILPLFDYGEEQMHNNIYTYMVMPLRRDGSLAQWLKQNATLPLDPQKAMHFIQQAAAALQRAHRHQIIHQDVKPANFLILPNEEQPELPDLQLADFGIAKFQTLTTSMSQTSRGTPAYMAPEQWSGQPVPATDQYALAIMAYQLLTGHMPFQGRMEQIMYHHINTAPLAPVKHNPTLPLAVDNVLLRALAKRPEERFPSIMDFARALQQALQSQPVPEITATSAAEPIVEATVTQPQPAPEITATSVTEPVAEATVTPPQPVQAMLPAYPSKRRGRNLLIALAIIILILLVGTGTILVSLSSQGQHSISASVSHVHVTPTARSHTQEGQIPVPPSFKKLSSADLNISLQYPPTWQAGKPQKDSYGNNSIVIQSTQNTPMTFQIYRLSSTTTSQFSSADDVNQYLLTDVQQSAQSGSNKVQVTPSAISQSSIGGTTWARKDAIISGSSSGVKYHFIFTTVMHNKVYYTIIASATDTYYNDALQKYIQPMFDSFQFLS